MPEISLFVSVKDIHGLPKTIPVSYEKSSSNPVMMKFNLDLWEIQDKGDAGIFAVKRSSGIDPLDG